MRDKKFWLGLLSMLLLSSTHSYADSAALTGGHAFITASTGFGYIRTSTGAFNCDSVSNVVNCDARVGGLDGNINAGYLWYKNNFAYGAAVGYTYFPSNHYKINYSNGTADDLQYTEGDNIDLLGIGKYFITPKLMF